MDDQESGFGLSGFLMRVKEVALGAILQADGLLSDTRNELSDLFLKGLSVFSLDLHAFK